MQEEHKLIKLSLENIKDIELKLLDEVDKICISNGLKYSLCAGSLLGAIRHRGFIPWDDDIDIMMPRSDYTRFLSYCFSNRGSLSFDLLCHEYNKEYKKMYAKVVDKNTILKDSVVVDSSSLGVFVDVFPVDYIDDDYNAAVVRYNRSSIWRRILLAKQWKRFHRNKNYPLYYEPIRLLLFGISKMVSADTLIDRIEAIYPKERKKFSGCICGSYGIKEVLPTEVFEKFTNAKFEDREFSIFEMYSDYLKSLYGDYMKLPPKDKQISHHTFDAYLINE